MTDKVLAHCADCGKDGTAREPLLSQMRPDAKMPLVGDAVCQECFDAYEARRPSR